MSDKNGWVKYWICDKSGNGREQWRYLYLGEWANDETSKDEVRSYIIDRWESWANYAERCSFGLEVTNVIPTAEELGIALDHFRTRERDYSKIVALLEAQEAAL